MTGTKEDARGRAGTLVQHIADTIRDSPDAEYVRGKVTDVLTEGRRVKRTDSERGNVVCAVRDALRGAQGDFVRVELTRVLRNDELRRRGFKVKSGNAR